MLSLKVNVSCNPVLELIQFNGPASTTPPTEITSCSFKKGSHKILMYQSEKYLFSNSKGSIVDPFKVTLSSPTILYSYGQIGINELVEIMVLCNFIVVVIVILLMIVEIGRSTLIRNH